MKKKSITPSENSESVVQQEIINNLKEIINSLLVAARLAERLAKNKKV